MLFYSYVYHLVHAQAKFAGHRCNIRWQNKLVGHNVQKIPEIKRNPVQEKAIKMRLGVITEMVLIMLTTTNAWTEAFQKQFRKEIFFAISINTEEVTTPFSMVSQYFFITKTSENLLLSLPTVRNLWFWVLAKEIPWCYQCALHWLRRIYSNLLLGIEYHQFSFHVWFVELVFGLLPKPLNIL